MTTLDSLGVEQYDDAGPGRVLSKLAARCIKGASAVTAGCGGDRCTGLTSH
jgi:malonyl CoA-acyl carrier protein transacylase